MAVLQPAIILDDPETESESESEPEPEPVPEPEEYQVKKIWDKRIGQYGVEYLIEWVGYDIEDNTWEPSANLQGSPGFDVQLALFEASLPNQQAQ